MTHTPHDQDAADCPSEELQQVYVRAPPSARHRGMRCRLFHLTETERKGQSDSESERMGRMRQTEAENVGMNRTSVSTCVGCM